MNEDLIGYTWQNEEGQTLKVVSNSVAPGYVNVKVSSDDSPSALTVRVAAQVRIHKQQT